MDRGIRLPKRLIPTKLSLVPPNDTNLSSYCFSRWNFGLGTRGMLTIFMRQEIYILPELFDRPICDGGI
jgi:hypothetical protein